MAQREQCRALVDEEELLHGVCLESALEAQVLFFFCELVFINFFSDFFLARAASRTRRAGAESAALLTYSLALLVQKYKY